MREGARVIPAEKSRTEERHEAHRERAGHARLHRARAIERGNPAIARDRLFGRRVRRSRLRLIPRPAPPAPHGRAPGTKRSTSGETVWDLGRGPTPEKP